MWWFSRCLFTVKPFLSNEILCLTLICEGGKLADPGPQPFLPMVPGCLRHIWLVGAGGGPEGTWFQSPGLNTGSGGSASFAIHGFATKTFLSLLFSGLEFPLWWNDGFAQTISEVLPARQSAALGYTEGALGQREQEAWHQEELACSSMKALQLTPGKAREPTPIPRQNGLWGKRLPEISVRALSSSLQKNLVEEGI